MILHRMRRDFRTGRAELQTMAAQSPGAGAPRVGASLWDTPGDVGHPCSPKGTVGASGVLSVKGEALEGGGLLPLNPLRMGISSSSRAQVEVGAKLHHSRGGVGAGEEGPDIPIPSGLKYKP